jgi:hypothetical protein
MQLEGLQAAGSRLMLEGFNFYISEDIISSL